ncbi:hypothetical protein [Campylobacter lanienae]|uniref:hypothetical protein n=1 Tax=Campylobacter lanienae TaxID=75658 RepID=UPI000BB4325A
MQKIFIPIKNDNIAHYFGAGIIKAKGYFKKDDINDIQNLYPNNIIALKDKKLPRNADCLIAVLIEDELIQDSGNVIILNDPIAISRIDKIYIKDIDLVDRLISNMNMATNTVGGVAVVNKELFEKLDIEQNLSVILNLSPSPVDEDKLRTKLEKFNRIMGAMAFISHKENNNLNKTLFDILSILNKDIATEYKKVTNFEPNLQTIPIKELDLSSYEILNFKDCKNKLDEKNISAGFKDKFEVPMDKFKLSDIDTGLQILYDLFKASDPISSEKIKDMSNDALFLYGYNKGYDNLRTFYKEKKVKFDIDRFIGRAIIEIIYQYSIKEKTNIDISFLKKYMKLKNKIEYGKYYLFDSLQPISINDFIDEYNMCNFYKNDPYLTKYIEEDKNLSKILNEFDKKNQEIQKMKETIDDLYKQIEEGKKLHIKDIKEKNQIKKENIILKRELNINLNDILIDSDTLDKNYIINNNHNIEATQEKKYNPISEINKILDSLNSKQKPKSTDYKNAINEIKKIINKDKSLFDYESTN